MDNIRTINGDLVARDLRFAIVASRFNDFIVDRLISGAVDCLVRHGADKADITIVRTPGAFELPVICKRLAQSGKFEGIIALGAVIRGATPHFEYVAAESSKGLAHVALDSGLPIGFGLLTTDSLEQAVERAGSKAGNKGAEAALSVLESARVLQQI